MKTNLKNIFKNIWRYPLKRRLRRRLSNHDFVLISSNCIGGCLLHDIGEEFCTPTINLDIPEFVSFCEELEYYLNKTPELYSLENFPVFKIEGITIRGIHYKSEEEFLNAWKRRTVRCIEKIKNGAEIIIIATDKQLKETNAKERFLNLPYKKVCFTSNKEWAQYKEFVYTPEFKGQENVGDLTKFTGLIGLRIFEKHFDCISFLNDIERSANIK